MNRYDNKYKSLGINIVLFGVNSIATKLISFILVPLYTSYLNAAEYGLIDMSTTVISLLLPLITLDISEAALRYIVNRNCYRSMYVAFSFFITIFSIVVMAVITPIFDCGAFGGLGDFKGWLVLDYSTSALMNLCGEIARASGFVRLIPICAGASSLITLICSISLIAVNNMGIIGYFVSVFVGPLIAIIIYMTYGQIASMVVDGYKQFYLNGFQTITDIVSPMFRYSLPLVPNSLFWWVSTSINRLFITGMLGISLSGLFAAASKIPSLINTVYGTFQQAWQLSAFQESSSDEIGAFYSSIFRIMSSFLSVICSLISLCSPFLAGVFLKGETYQAWPMIPILLLANLMNVFNSFYGTVYTASLHTSYVMRTTIYGAISCIVLTPLFILLIGVNGACWASVIGQSLVFLLRERDSHKYIDFNPEWNYLAPTLFLLLMQALASSQQVQYWPLLSVVITIVIFVLHLFRFRVLLIHRLERSLNSENNHVN